MPINLIPTLNAEHLAKLLAQDKNFYVHYPRNNKDGRRFFPDGEVYSRLDELPPAEKTVIIHAGAPEPNQGLVELEFTLTALKNRGLAPLELFFSYFP